MAVARGEERSRRIATDHLADLAHIMKLHPVFIESHQAVEVMDTDEGRPNRPWRSIANRVVIASVENKTP